MNYSKHEITKWILTVFTSCLLIYVGIRHISSIIDGILAIVEIIKPLLLGLIIAMILNVPMSLIERFLNNKTSIKGGTRFISIALALLLVLGIFALVAVLLVPELINAIKLIITILQNSILELSHMDIDPALLSNPLFAFLSTININWNELQSSMETWINASKESLLSEGITIVGIIGDNIIALFVGLVFSIYILANKELLKHQVCRLIQVWLPQKVGATIIHVSQVCNQTFKSFIAGQATEAIILGTLCMTGMLILKIPYAPMVGALIGVTALVPILGAFIGTIVGAIMILTVNPFKALLFVIFLLILQQFEGNLIYPKVVGSKIKLPAMWVLAAVTIGGNLYGPLGMLLGVPATSAAYTLIREATEYKQRLAKDC